MSSRNQEFIDAMPTPDWQTLIALVQYAEVFLQLRGNSVHTDQTGVDDARAAIFDTLQAFREVLVEALQGGEEIACGQLFFKHRAACMDWVLRCSGRETLAEQLK